MIMGGGVGEHFSRLTIDTLAQMKGHHYRCPKGFKNRYNAIVTSSKKEN
jgi:hypothetical protein